MPSVVLFTGLLIHYFPDREELFTARNGARKDATKILIVITDGRKEGDNKDYNDVIPKAEKAGIIRYAIGVSFGNG
jgi:hypothetical protein